MNYLQNLLSTVSSYFLASKNSIIWSRASKRRRSVEEDDDDDVVLIEDSENSPPKKLKCNAERTLSETNGKIMKSSSTQTHSGFGSSLKSLAHSSGLPNVKTVVIDDDVPSLCTTKSKNAYKPPKHLRSPLKNPRAFVPSFSDNTMFVDLTDASEPVKNKSVNLPNGRSRSQHSFRLAQIDDDASCLSPTKFKNAYKAPKHVRSPNKNQKSFAPSSSDTTTVVDLTDASEPAKNVLGELPNGRNQSQHSSCLAQWTSSGRFGEGMSHDAYEYLLGSVISSSARESMRKPSKSFSSEQLPVVDLTDEDDTKADITSIDLTRSPHVVNPVVRSSSQTETPTQRQQLARVNSFQEKIVGNKYLRPDLFSDRLTNHFENLRKFIDMRVQLENRAKYESTVSQAAVQEMLIKRLQSHVKLTDATILEEDEKDIDTVKPVLTDDMMARVNNAQNPKLNSNEILVTKFKLAVRREDFMTLKNLNWLNDAVINFYMELIVERGQINDNYPSVYAFSTFFFPALHNGYDRVRRYTKKVDLFSKEIILVPIHLSVHWCMAKIDMKRKEITYYDSMLNSNQKVLKMLLDYLISELQDKKKETFDATGWTLTNEKGIPSQKNGSDCGVFACTFAEYLSRKAKFNFAQKDMPYMRSKMCFEILTGKLLT